MIVRVFVAVSSRVNSAGEVIESWDIGHSFDEIGAMAAAYDSWRTMTDYDRKHNRNHVEAFDIEADTLEDLPELPTAKEVYQAYLLAGDYSDPVFYEDIPIVSK